MQDSKIAGLAEGLDDPVLKLFKRGTHRIISPDDTLARIAPKAPQIGITRLGNVTGLDRIGIPVTVAIRPNSRSVSVSQGKGLGLSQALASALMEAIELFHAEEPAGRAVEASFLELSANARVVRPGLSSWALTMPRGSAVRWPSRRCCMHSWCAARCRSAGRATGPRVGAGGIGAHVHIVRRSMACRCSRHRSERRR